MQNASKGFTLLMVLIIMQLVAMVTFANLNVVLSYRQLQKSIADYTRISVEVQKLFPQIARITLVEKLSCTISISPVPRMMQRSDRWWAQHGCQLGDANQIAYVIEKLAADPCLLISKKLSARFYRVTLAYFDNLNSNKRLFQLTIIQGEPLLIPCVDAPRMHSSGILHWQELLVT